MFFEEQKNLDFWNLLLLLLDLGIVAFLFYHILRLLSRTHALQLLVGVVILLLADVVSRYLKLMTLSWIISNVSVYLVFGMIVLMQPELRRLASGLGQSDFFRRLYPTQTVPVAELIVAARSMAAKRIGSIIVILGRLRPQSIIEQAVLLNAKISPELIETIFSNRSPLHDGAVIVEGDKILAASCYLPLSHSSKLKKTHGSRHRAALGISEETDAVVIVTSEESGKIAVTMDGEILSPKVSELENFVQSLLLGKRKKVSTEKQQ